MTPKRKPRRTEAFLVIPWHPRVNVRWKAKASLWPLVLLATWLSRSRCGVAFMDRNSWYEFNLRPLMSSSKHVMVMRNRWEGFHYPFSRGNNIFSRTFQFNHFYPDDVWSISSLNERPTGAVAVVAAVAWYLSVVFRPCVNQDGDISGQTARPQLELSSKTEIEEWTQFFEL